ncbi:MAG TPA: DUF167 domain-containing protein [Pyrinomonadaceae bacterium]|jgi:uncharacterized protein (TIGR00251 family)|nr:DUF167 domain-containing protein [Pyrinomonadaceae bacterium]
MLNYTEANGAITFAVRVVPRASRTEFAGVHEDALRVRLAAPPVEGAANKELICFLARALGVAARNIEIISGLTSKIKRVRVHGSDGARLQRIAVENSD